MISSVSIKNFKGFQNFHIKGLAPITLIGGKNNVGKSSFLEALFLLYSAYAPQAFGQQFSLRGAGNLYHNTIENWAVMFYNGDVDKHRLMTGIISLPIPLINWDMHRI